ncbi:NAD(P)H-dependent oxidoreductase [Aquibaculum sediminis]|uniref:NAD(P)H-dependent oxidoreductase n=1 Tax=Aquibaculum sediminis TaxID=3231907 RepID=UPI003451A177
MNLYQLLQARAEAGRPVRVVLIGAGKFGAMFLAQARLMTGLHVMGIADLNVERARETCRRTGWEDERFSAHSASEAVRSGATWITDDASALIAAEGVDVVLECTGHPAAGIRHCLEAIDAGRHVVMVNVEADVVAGPLLARRARQAGVVYSLAYGDQPAVICEHVDWARACGFKVVSAGKGTRYHPDFHASTPETVWENFGISPEMAARGGMNPKMYNSFIDGTKSGIEMTAVCNATGLTPQPNGLSFPPASCYDLAEICKPRAAGGQLSHEGTTEVVSSLNRDRTPVEHHLQIGTYVVVEAESDYVRNCIEEFKFLPDSSFRFSALYRPTHLIGLELGISIASIALRGEATGAPTGFRSDVVATAKRDLAAGEILDGEGGFCVWGRQMPAERSLEIGGLPLGLAQGVKLKVAKMQGEALCWNDVELDENDIAVRIRREMERAFAPETEQATAAIK